MGTLPLSSSCLSFTVLEGVGKEQLQLEQQEAEVGVRV